LENLINDDLCFLSVEYIGIAALAATYPHGTVRLKTLYRRGISYPPCFVDRSPIYGFLGPACGFVRARRQTEAIFVLFGSHRALAGSACMS
jgi:hypothetical protein